MRPKDGSRVGQAQTGRTVPRSLWCSFFFSLFPEDRGGKRETSARTHGSVACRVSPAPRTELLCPRYVNSAAMYLPIPKSRRTRAGNAAGHEWAAQPAGHRIPLGTEERNQNRYPGWHRRRVRYRLRHSGGVRDRRLRPRTWATLAPSPGFWPAMFRSVWPSPKSTRSHACITIMRVESNSGLEHDLYH